MIDMYKNQKEADENYDSVILMMMMMEMVKFYLW